MTLNSYQSRKALQNNFDANRQNTQTTRNEYALDRHVSHESSGDDYCYRARLYGYPPENDDLDPAERFPQHFVHRHWKGKPYSDIRKRR